MSLYLCKTWVEFAVCLLNPCLYFLCPITAAKSLLNKKADVKVRWPPDLLAPDLGLCTFFLAELCHCFRCCYPPHQCRRPRSWLLRRHRFLFWQFRAPNVTFCLCGFMCLCLCQVWMTERIWHSVFSIQNQDLYVSYALFFPTFRGKKDTDLNHFLRHLIGCSLFWFFTALYFISCSAQQFRFIDKISTGVMYYWELKTEKLR